MDADTNARLLIVERMLASLTAETMRGDDAAAFDELARALARAPLGSDNELRAALESRANGFVESVRDAIRLGGRAG